MQNSAPANVIDRVVVDAILAGRIAAGTRLGEQSLGNLFSVSRTVAREVLIRFEAQGNRALADIVRDLTARTVLNSLLYQPGHDATVFCDEHAAITEALAAGDLRRGADLTVFHSTDVEAGLTRTKTTIRRPASAEP